jgi:hypothetical protein
MPVCTISALKLAIKVPVLLRQKLEATAKGTGAIRFNSGNTTSFCNDLVVVRALLPIDRATSQQIGWRDVQKAHSK